jgi:nucleotide-binding universal stress UspA family protein
MVTAMPTIQHILFPYDGSERGQQIVPYVRSLAERFQARVTIIGVIPPTFAHVPAQAGLHLREGAEISEWRRHLQAELDRAFLDEFEGLLVDRVAEGGDPAFRIVDFASHHGVDLIAMPTHGTGLYRTLLIGSVAAKVLHDARCPVWTAAHTDKQCASSQPRRILCAVDGSPNTLALVRWTSNFARTMEATFTVLHVVGPVSDLLELKSEQRLQNEVGEIARLKIQNMLVSQGISAPLQVATGHVVRCVAEEARQSKADLVIIDRGHTAQPFGRLRSHAFGIIQQSPCPVLSA